MQHTTTHPRIAVIPQQPVVNKSVFIVALALFGVVSILAGITNLVSAIIPSLNGSTPVIANSTWTDIGFNLSLGVLIIASLTLFVEGRMLSVWLYAGGLIVDGIYHILMGYPLNYLFMGFGLVLIWQLLKFRKELKLT